jgi:DNA-binding protein H-NS
MQQAVQLLCAIEATREGQVVITVADVAKEVEYAGGLTLSISRNLLVAVKMSALVAPAKRAKVSPEVTREAETGTWSGRWLWIFSCLSSWTLSMKPVNHIANSGSSKILRFS